MTAIVTLPDSQRYARSVEASKRVRWDVEADVIRGRRFDTAHKFLPDGLVLTAEFTTLSPAEKRFVSQIQGRTYANVFGLVERFINAKVLELSHEHWFGDQHALEALVRFSDEELKHQALFRRIDAMIGEVLPDGYRFEIDANAVAHAVLGKSTWAVLALTLDIELFTQTHYLESIDHDAGLSELFKDVFLFHWKEESQHAILDELEWVRHDGELTAAQRDRASTSSSSWWLRWTASCRRRPKPTPSTSRRRAAARSARRSRGPWRPHSSRRIAGSTSTPAPSSRTSGRCCPG
jgi:hypothetical protein